MRLSGQELDVLDKVEAWRGRMAREERRDGEEELVDESGGEELPEERRAGLGDDHAVAALAQSGDGGARDRRARRR